MGREAGYAPAGLDGEVGYDLGDLLRRQPVLQQPLPQRLPCVWTYRDRSLEKDSHFPVKLSKWGPDKSKRIVDAGAVLTLPTSVSQPPRAGIS